MHSDRGIRTAFRVAGGIAGVLITLGSAPAEGATFDCSAYATYVDRITCEDQRLSALDAEHDRVLDLLRRQHPDAAGFINETAGKRKNQLYAECTSVDCISAWYEGEIRAIKDGKWAQSPPRPEITARSPADEPAAASVAPASQATGKPVTDASPESDLPRQKRAAAEPAVKTDLMPDRPQKKSEPSFFATAAGVVVGVLVFPLSWLLCGFLGKYGVSNWEKNRRSALEMVFWRGVVSIMLAAFAGKSLTGLLSGL